MEQRGREGEGSHCRKQRLARHEGEREREREREREN